jgi:transposase
VHPNPDDPWKDFPIMRALDPEVVDAVWSAVQALLPPPPRDDHPLGCHRPRVDDQTCFEGILLRLVTGCSWVDAERLMGNRVSDTTLRARRDEWVTAGVFDRLVEEALAAYDRIIGFDLRDCAVDASLQKAPRAGEGSGPSPVDRGKRGWKWSLFADRNGIPLGWVAAAANRNDCVLLEPTIAKAAARGLAPECLTLHLDRGYDNGVVRAAVAAAGIGQLVCSRVRPPNTAMTKKIVPLGMRWPIERTNSWLSNFGQLRRNTDRRAGHRLAQLALAIVFLLTARLIDWRDRWSLA